MTKQELKRYSKLSINLARLEGKIQSLQDSITSPKAQVITDMPRGGRPADMADKIAKLADLQMLYNKQWDELIAEQLHIEQAIASLSDPVERALMGYRYIDGLTWEQIAVKVNYAWAQTHRAHSNALKNLKDDTQ